MPSELLLERRLRLKNADFEDPWYLVRYSREYPLVIGFEAWETWFSGREDQPPSWTLKDPFHVGDDKKSAIVQGSVKFDGCVNYEVLDEGPRHACSREGLVSIGLLLGRVYDQCAELLGVIDGHWPDAEPVKLDTAPCVTCGLEGGVNRSMGISLSTDVGSFSDHCHDQHKTTYSYICKNGHSWQELRVVPCPVPTCPHGRGLEEAIDRARSCDRRRK